MKSSLEYLKTVLNSLTIWFEIGDRGMANMKDVNIQSLKCCYPHQLRDKCKSLKVDSGKGLPLHW